MKLVTLLVPANQPRPYPSATPVPYQSGTVDAFERALADIGPVILRQPNAMRLLPDPGGRWIVQEVVTPYQLVCDPADTALGDAIALTIKSFKLEKVTVLAAEADGEDFTTDAAAELQSGIHPWQENA